MSVHASQTKPDGYVSLFLRHVLVGFLPFVTMAASTGYGPRKEFGSRWNRLCFDGDEKNYELWETKFLAHLRLLSLKKTILSEPPDEDGDGAEEDAKKNEDAYAELVQLLDDKSLSLVMRDAADDGRKR